MLLKNSLRSILIIFLLAAFSFAQEVKYVIHISIDGGGSNYIQDLIDHNKLPNFKRLEQEGAGTFNARTDFDYTVTLPNHTTQITGRGVLGETGHNWKENTDPKKGQTIQKNKKAYIASIFDVAHDNGLTTALFTGKLKFSLYDKSYDAENGEEDKTGPDNGRDKIDSFVYNWNSAAMTDAFIEAMRKKPFNYVFLHYADPDGVGHAVGWGGKVYDLCFTIVDEQIGKILDFVSTDPILKDNAIIVLTADHGGSKNNHEKADEPLHYTIPFLVWGAGVSPGADLYAINKNTRRDPGTGRPNYSESMQPIRNGDSANLELKLLGLGPVPGSTINAKQDLKVTAQKMTEN